MDTETTDYTAWIGATETVEDEISLAPVLGLAALLDDAETAFGAGASVPPLWHWLYFLPRAPQSKLGPDGHPERGGFMPPIALPRRMFAGARMTFHRPLAIGGAAQRKATIRNVSEKQGRSGRLAFVTVAYELRQDGTLCLEEEQDIVYREPGAAVSPPEIRELPAVPDDAWVDTVTPDPVMLFRFSALTFNGHRIHYDRPYATAIEGYPGLVVHGPLTAVLLMELVRRRADRPVVGFSFQGRAPLFDLAPFRLIATPKDGGEVSLKAEGPDGATAMTAVATLG